MTNFENEGGAGRTELLQRIELMETMIAEGRQTTARHGWIFVLWGLVYVAAIGLQMVLPSLANYAWPVCIAAGIAGTWMGKARQRQRAGSGESPKSRSIWSVWSAMGLGITLYVVGAVVSHQVMTPAYTAAILFFIGLAHATSALILRWTAQGMAAAVWWIGGFACFFVSAKMSVGIFMAAAFFGMIVFGAYAMMRERRRAAELKHA